MDKTYIRTVLTPENLMRPELSGFVGREVVIHIADAEDDPFEDLIDHEYMAECQARLDEDQGEVPTIEEVRRILSRIPGSLSQDIIDDREDRV